MFANRTASSTNCSIWQPETSPSRFLPVGGPVAVSKLQHIRQSRQLDRIGIGPSELCCGQWRLLISVSAPFPLRRSFLQDRGAIFGDGKVGLPCIETIARVDDVVKAVLP